MSSFSFNSKVLVFLLKVQQSNFLVSPFRAQTHAIRSTQTRRGIHFFFAKAVSRLSISQKWAGEAGEAGEAG